MSPYIKIFKVPHTDIWSNVWESCVKYESLCTLWWSTCYISHLPRLAGLCLIRYWQFLEPVVNSMHFLLWGIISIALPLIEIKKNFKKKGWPFETVEQNPQMYYNSWMMAKMTHVLKQVEFWKYKELLSYCSLCALHVRILTVQWCQIHLKLISWIIELQFGGRWW